MKFDFNLQFWNGEHVMKKALISYVSPLASEGEKMGCGFEINYFSLDKRLITPPYCIDKGT